MHAERKWSVVEELSIRDELMLRAQTYNALCSLVLQAPDDESLRALQQAYSAAEGCLASFVRGLPADGDSLESVRVELEAEFCALSPDTSENPVFPCESAYAEDPDGVAGGVGHAVSSAYAQAGFQVGEDEGLPADHIGVEMAFMARLIEGRIAALDAGDDERASELAHVQRRFLDEHLVACALPFCAELAERARSDFYRGVSEEIEGFLAFEVDRAR